MASGSNQFAFDLFNNVAPAQKDANVFFSPLSISTALSTVYEGGRGETQQQMAQVLHLQESQAEVAAGFHSRMTSLSPPASAPYQLSVANALWAQQGVGFLAEFVSVMDKYYGGDLKTLNFADTEASRATINRWVSDKTSGKIRQLLQTGDIDRLTRLVLTNAVYFKGIWSSPFREQLTKPAPFTTAGGAEKQVPTMHRTGSYRYAQIADMQLLELPYKGDQLSMLILLPQVGAKQPFADLTWVKLQQWRWKMSIAEVEVFLPKFKVEARLSLAPTLSHMGMRDAFAENSADFSAITGQQGVVHFCSRASGRR